MHVHWVHVYRKCMYKHNIVYNLKSHTYVNIQKITITEACSSMIVLGVIRILTIIIELPEGTFAIQATLYTNLKLIEMSMD